MKRIAAGAVAVVVAAIAAWSTVGPRRRPPHVLILVMDTTRGDRCSFNGYPRPTTPRLDVFARDATVFTDAWVPAGWTGPTHASLFTGVGPERHGFIEGNRPFLADDAETLAERFAAHGYRTGAFSNNWVVAPEWGLTQGFETYAPMYKRERDGTPPARETHRRALDWAGAVDADGEPFFLFINDIEPHLPYEPAAAAAAPFLTGEPSPAELAEATAFNHPSGVGYILGRVEVDGRRMRLLSDLYDAEIAVLDAEIGTLLDGLRELDLLDRTVVVITSDHGENLGEHGLMDHKFSLHRTLLHVPLLIRFPGRFDGGRRVERVVRLEDVAPTVLELAGIEIPPGLDGVTLTDLEAPRLVRAAWGIWARFEEELTRSFPGADTTPLYTSIRAVYDGRHHLIRYSDGREELYDVAADPMEINELTASRPDLARRLRRRLRQP